MSKRGRKEYSAARAMAVQIKVLEERKVLEKRTKRRSSINAACKSLAERGELFHGAYTADGTKRFVTLSASALSGAYYRAKKKYGGPR